MTSPSRRRATYQDVIDAPEHMIAEIVDGELYQTSRPGGPHTVAATQLVGLLHAPFSPGGGGPGGWMVLFEPELHLDDDSASARSHSTRSSCRSAGCGPTWCRRGRAAHAPRSRSEEHTSELQPRGDISYAVFRFKKI